jgi:hypothetical protein
VEAGCEGTNGGLFFVDSLESSINDHHPHFFNLVLYESEFVQGYDRTSSF